MSVVTVDPSIGQIFVTTGVTLMTWGENLGVTVRPIATGVEVTVGSSSDAGRPSPDPL